MRPALAHEVVDIDERAGRSFLLKQCQSKRRGLSMPLDLNAAPTATLSMHRGELSIGINFKWRLFTAFWIASLTLIASVQRGAV